MLEPQLVIIHNNKIEKIFLLTILEDGYKNSKAYLYYENLKTDIPLTIIKSHIILTFDINTLKVFLNTLLNIKYEYVIYSDEGNVEFNYTIDEIFSPYNITYEFNKNEDIIYKSYPSCFNGLILYITSYDYLQPIFPHYTVISDNNLLYFITDLFQNYIDFEITYNYEKENFYLINITSLETLTILKKFNYKDYKITYIKKDVENYYIQGNNIRIFDFNKLLFNKSESLLVVTSNNNIILASDGNKVFCEEIELLEYILKIIRKFKIERTSNKILYNMKFNIVLEPQIQISSYFSHVITNTNSKNIYVTPDKLIVIIITKRKIIIKMNTKIDQLAPYITEIILYYIITNTKVKQSILNQLQKKIGISYLSRICQNVNNKMRKPFIYPTKEIDKSKYEEISNNFYINENSQLFIEDNISHLCDNEKNLGRKYLGFIEKFYSINNLCIPCCYLYPKEEDEIFLKCTNKVFSKSDDLTNPYILTYNKVLTQNRLSYLYPSIDKIFNKHSKIKIEKNRIVYAKDFYCIAYHKNEILENKAQVFEIIKNNNTFIFLKNIIILPFLDRYLPEIKMSSQLTFYVIIQNIVHKIIKINKNEMEDKIYINENVSELYNFIKEYNVSLDKPFKISNSNLEYNQNGFFIDGVKFTEKLTTNYLTSIPYLEGDELVDEDVDINNVETDDIDLFINTYNSNYLLRS